MSSIDWTQLDQRVFGMIGRCKNQTGCRAAAVVVKECRLILSNNPDWDEGGKAASVTAWSINKVKLISDFWSSTR